MKNTLLPVLIVSFAILTGSALAATPLTNSALIHPVTNVTIGEYMSTVQAETQATAPATSTQISTTTLLLTPPPSIDASFVTFFKKIFTNTAHFFLSL